MAASSLLPAGSVAHLRPGPPDHADAVSGDLEQEALDPLTRVRSHDQIPRRLVATGPGALVCVLELDGLKDVNDRLGRQVGDETLRRFGRHLRSRTRRDDFVARAGGGEFLLILDGNVETSVAYLRMSELATTWAQAEPHACTVSIGIAVVAEAGPMMAAVAADRAMYRAKRGDVAVEVALETDGSSSSESLAKDTYDAYLAALTSADASMAVTALVWGAERGMSQHDLVDGVIRLAQCEVGEKWASGAWGIADEHAATIVADQALTLIAPPQSRSSTATRVVMACAEGESHTMPVRLAAQLARSSELDIIVLGGSMPADDLRASLRVLAPAVLGLSVTVATNLIGARRCIDAARAEGVRVIVGGAAWGTGQQRAHRLGASLMLTDVGELARYVLHPEDLPDDAVASTPADLEDEAVLLERPPTALLDTALELWASRQEAEPTAADRREARDALDWIARHAAAAVACDDPSVVGDLLASEVGAAGGGGPELRSITDMCLALADTLTLQAPLAATILRGQTQQLAAG